MWIVKKEKSDQYKIELAKTISESIKKYLSNTSAEHKIKELQKAAILGTANILCKVLV
jgi:hypothetical protein